MQRITVRESCIELLKEVQLTMAALLSLLKASEFYRHCENFDYSLALHAYAYGLYKDLDVAEAF